MSNTLVAGGVQAKGCGDKGGGVASRKEFVSGAHEPTHTSSASLLSSSNCLFLFTISDPLVSDTPANSA